MVCAKGIVELFFIKRVIAGNEYQHLLKHHVMPEIALFGVE